MTITARWHKIVIKHSSLLITKTDGWPNKIINIRTSGNLINKEEVINMIQIAPKNGLGLIGQIEFRYEERILNWNRPNLDYIFIFYVLKKVESH